MKKTYYLMFFLALFILSCQKKAGQMTQKFSPAPTLGVESSTAVKRSVKKILSDNDYLDLDLSKLKGTDDTVKAKVCVYRFYKHVRLKDGFYVSDLSDESQIRISKSCYTFLLDGMNQLNDLKRLQKKKGKEVIFSEVDDTYLNSLIQ